MMKSYPTNKMLHEIMDLPNSQDKAILLAIWGIQSDSCFSKWVMEEILNVLGVNVYEVIREIQEREGSYEFGVKPL